MIGSKVIALIPARSGSKGIPGKNFRAFAGGPCLVWLACHAAFAARQDGIHLIDEVYVSSDIAPPLPPGAHWIKRPAALAQDDTPMFDVVKHAVNELADDDIVCLLQPTQPFRTPQHVQQALALLRETQADSVVSVVELPATHAAELQCEIEWGCLRPKGELLCWDCIPTCRQQVEPTYIRDGTVYAFWVKTLKSGTLYGKHVRPLIIPADESCELDSEADWADVERRWRERA
jgi:CMP-N,N'-diacetyllegionaminic acid synthase